MKKVGILVNSIGYGGNERSAVNIANAISNIFDVRIIIQEDCGNHYDYKGRVINLNTPCARSGVGKMLNSIRRIARLQRIIKKEQLESLLIILPVSNPINYMKLPCKKIVSCRDCGDLNRHLEKYISMTKRSDLIVCNSASQADYLGKAIPELTDSVKVIYNILDIEKIIQLKDEKPDKNIMNFMYGYKCIISTGRFAKAKGLNNLLKAFSVLARKDDNVRLLMIGDGELRCSIKELIDDLSLNDKVFLAGFQDNPFMYIAQSDIFVLPSFYEGFPNTLVEAMACGTPVIATDCPSGPAEIMMCSAGERYTISNCGVLVRYISEQNSTWNPNDINEDHVVLADAFSLLLNNKDLCTSLANRANERVRAFMADEIAGEWVTIL